MPCPVAHRLGRARLLPPVETGQLLDTLATKKSSMSADRSNESFVALGGELCSCLLHVIAVKCLTCGSLCLTFERESGCFHPSKWANSGRRNSPQSWLPDACLLAEQRKPCRRGTAPPQKSVLGVPGIKPHVRAHRSLRPPEYRSICDGRAGRQGSRARRRRDRTAVCFFQRAPG